MNQIRRVVLTGGGTAGHVNPALAIGSALVADGVRFLYIGIRGRSEEVVVPREGVPIKYVRASGFPGLRPSLALLKFAFDLAIGTLQAAIHLLAFRPNVIVGTGGYAAAPVVFAARALKILRLSRARIYLHEQNAVPGKMNRVTGSFASEVFLTFPETKPFFPGNGVVTGYPLRKKIQLIPRSEAPQGLDFEVPAGRKVVFVFGGSQGARTMNRALVDALKFLLPRAQELFVIHGTGLSHSASYDAHEDTAERVLRSYDDETRKRLASFYVSRRYFHEIERIYALADLVVVRAGAGTLNEISALGLPALVIPKANLPADHQVMNARALERAGGAEVIYEETVLDHGDIVEKIDGEVLAKRILTLLGDEPRRRSLAEKCRSFFPHEALVRIERRIRHPGTPLEDEEDTVRPLSVPSNAALLSRLERAAARGGSGWRVESEITDASDLAYFRSRAASLLAGEEWDERNLGVKLIGCLQSRDHVPLLLALFRDRRPAPPLERMFGGDFVQVGFIRRNVMMALGRIGLVNARVEEALLAGMDDPYYEVRTEAARVAGGFGSRLSGRRRFEEALLRLLDDRLQEVAVAAALALGDVGSKDGALPALLALSRHRMWMRRSAALAGILSLVERNEVDDRGKIASELREMVLTSTDFTPTFEIKDRYRRLFEALASKEDPSR